MNRETRRANGHNGHVIDPRLVNIMPPQPQVQQIVQPTVMNDRQVLGMMAATIAAGNPALSPRRAATLAAEVLEHAISESEALDQRLLGKKIRAENARRQAAGHPLLTTAETGIPQSELERMMKEGIAATADDEIKSTVLQL